MSTHISRDPELKDKPETDKKTREDDDGHFFPLTLQPNPTHPFKIFKIQTLKFANLNSKLLNRLLNRLKDLISN